jgi:hypothetical protein
MGLTMMPSLPAKDLILGVLLVVVVAALNVGAAPPASTTPAAGTTPVSKAAVLSIADKQLSRDYRAYLKDRTASIRQQSDFFTSDPPGAAVDKNDPFTADDVLTALERNIPGDVRIACYVKWQLLSAMPADPTPAAVARLMALYRDAPKPFARYGMAPAERDKLEKMRMYPQKAAEPFNRDLNEDADRANKSNEPIFAYRDELYAKLPDGPAKFKAGLADAADRANAGSVDGTRVKVAAVADNVRAWLDKGNLEAKERDEVTEIVYKAREFSGLAYYASARVSWGVLKWDTSQVTLDAQDELKSLYRDLREARN